MWVLSIFVILSWLTFPFILEFLISWTSSSLTLNEYGDMYGSLNTLFSGVAFLAMYRSIRLQSKEIRDNRLEMQANRKEMQEQTQLFNLQTQAVQKEMFETTFFQLLSAFKGLTENVFYEEYDDSGEVRNVIYGSRCFTIFYNRRFTSIYKLDENEKLEVVVEAAYESFNSEYGYIVGPYFRMLYEILSFVDSVPYSFVDKTKYINILKSQLSTYELGLLFFYGLSIYGKEHFKELIEKYAVFENLPVFLMRSYNNSLNIMAFVHLYSSKAYGKTNKVALDCFSEK